MRYGYYPPYIPVAERQRRAKNKLKQLAKKGEEITPVTIEGRKIAKNFWGEAWCENLERYSDYASRLPRGRSYVRNGSVVDLKIAAGEVTAQVAGSELYRITITIAPVKREAWRSICRDCAGTVSSLVELLQGRLAKGVMERVCRKGDGLFPAPKDINLSCSCPDWATMCKHVAATLYGVAVRLDERPELLFLLRGVDRSELIAGGPQAALSAPAAATVLEDGDVAALFGIEMAETAAAAPLPARRRRAEPKVAPGRTGQGAGSAARGAGAKTVAGTKIAAGTKTAATKTAAANIVARGRTKAEAVRAPGKGGVKRGVKGGVNGRSGSAPAKRSARV